MKDRLSAMRRVLAVQGQVKRLAEWQLAALEARKRELDDLGRELECFNDSPEVSGHLALLGLRQRRRLAARASQAESERQVQAEATRDARSREKLAEQLVADLTAEDRRSRETRDLEALIEAFAHLGNTECT